jgi:hypothetical protein
MTVQEASAVPRSSVSDVYNFIIQDLQFAISALPASWTSATDIGRATSYAARGLLGLVYLTKSGPTYNIDGGPGLNSNEYDKALSLFNEIINSGKYAFSSDFPSIFSYSNENNKEVLFDIQFMSANGSSSANGGEFPSQLIPDAFWSGLGLSNYGNGYGSASYNVTTNMLQSYRWSAGPGVTDVRDTFSINHGYRTSTTSAAIDTTRPFLKKYVNVALRGKDRADWPINWIVMRYTDVLMMKAECILHGAPGGTQADVNAIVNQVRKRAGIPALTGNVDLPTLMEERRREFLGEGLRWDDLVREGMAVTTMNAWRTSDNITTIHEIVPQYIIYPIPQVEILAKPGLYDQNAGYY